MRVLFTVQGEGRGHLTQAIALHDILQRHGHQVVGVTISANGRAIPDYFQSAFQVPITPVPSPGFVFAGSRGVSMNATLRRVLAHAPRYREGLRTLDALLQRTRPDLVVNFLEPLAGLYNLLRRPAVPSLVVGHHYMFEHPDFKRVHRFPLQQWGLRNYIRIVGARSARLALSFYPAPDRPRQSLFVSPPLLRRPLFELPSTRSEGQHLLVYLLNHGYAREILRWHQTHPNVPIHCFYDRPSAQAEEHVTPNLTFHRLHGQKFLKLMATCRGLACTAGFESACEAAYLAKPLLLIPVENHVEQYLNACDAAAAGIATHGSSFSLSPLLAPQAPVASTRFRHWVDRAETIVLAAVETVAGLRPANLPARQPELQPGPAPA